MQGISQCINDPVVSLEGGWCLTSLSSLAQAIHEKARWMTETSTQQRDELPDQEKHYVYIVQCTDSSLYTGYARNVESRVAIHNAGKGGRYTRSHLPVTLLASWSFASKSEALRAEYAIKQLSRVQKLRLVESATKTPVFPLKGEKTGDS
jgi:putative endonuclease